ncbi:MAG: hypothetical protein ACLUIE_10695 [Parabacteroides merdae]
MNGKLFIREPTGFGRDAPYTPTNVPMQNCAIQKQSGINLIRMWGGGGIAESDYFFQLCDEMGLLVRGRNSG